MGVKIYNPAKSTSAKNTPGFSDVLVADSGTYKFMGCSVLSMSTTLGFNGIASSLSVVLVEDTENGDFFIEPTLPSIWGFSLPLGGVGQPIIYPNGIDLNPDGFTPSNTPFYFTGLCTNWTESIVDIGGRTISVNLVDPREILGGVQCLLNGFSLSQTIGTGARVYTGIKNVMDLFGYWNYGMESGSNDYGMPWNNIKIAIEDLQVTVDGIEYEFIFTGNCFINTPIWYRIPDQVIDLLSLINRVCQDGGSDLVTIARKVSISKCVVEIRGISRTNALPLTKLEIDSFIQTRGDIVSNAKVGKEYKNEPTSSIIIGGFQNSNYTAYPSEFDLAMHMTSKTFSDGLGGSGEALVEDYAAFPADIKTRLFGGTLSMPNVPDDGTPITYVNQNYQINSGAIFPYWGTTNNDYQYPLIEPFIILDHLVFDKNTEAVAQLKSRIPICFLGVQNYAVRQVPHSDVFLDGDGDSDERPFAFLVSYIVNVVATPDGWVRGLPLNTEVLRAALVSELAFWRLYDLYYPDIAQYLGCPTVNYQAILDYCTSIVGNDGSPDLINFPIHEYINDNPSVLVFNNKVALDTNGNSPTINWSQGGSERQKQVILGTFRSIIYSQIQEYAKQHLGKQFIVCLPASNIMQRIWANLPVPTKPLKPIIEYSIDGQGYWEEVPSELSNIVDPNAPPSIFTASETDQIRRRFMMDDGRFYPMVGVDWKPQGNINFKSNGYNKAMFQDLDPTQFRPNNIASQNPSYILLAPDSITTLPRRPDLAIVTIPPMMHDPELFISYYENANLLPNIYYGGNNQSSIATKAGIINGFWQCWSRNNILRQALTLCSTVQGVDPKLYTNTVFTSWVNDLFLTYSEPYKHQITTEFVMDLKGVIIPLTSNWVSYGPWWATYDKTQGMVNVVVDPSIVPWNYDRPAIGESWDQNLNAAGIERLERSISDLEYIDTASITCVGFPEFGPASEFGYNSNITSITTDFSIGGVKTTYGMSTYGAKPGTFRKEEYDDLTRGRYDPRIDLSKLIQPQNTNIYYETFGLNMQNKNMFD